MAADMSLVVGDVDITRLSDEELYQQLTALGAVVGPIVGTTRKTYERKLAVLLGGKVANYSFTEKDTSAIANDADEPDDAPSQAYIELVSGTARRRKPQHVARPVEDYRDEDDDEEEEVEEINTPSCLYTSSSASPRSYTEKSPNERRFLQSQPSPLPSPFRECQVEEQDGPEQKQSPTVGGTGSMLFTVLTVIVFALLVYYFFLAGSEKDAFARLENLAKKAAEQQQGAGSRQGL